MVARGSNIFSFCFSFVRFWYYAPRKIWQPCFPPLVADIIFPPSSRCSRETLITFFDCAVGPKRVVASDGRIKYRDRFYEDPFTSFRTNFHPQISDKFSSSNFGQIFILKFRTNFHHQISDKISPLNFGQMDNIH
jgi:hypothetical protein